MGGLIFSMAYHAVPVWKNAPFLRLFVPLAAGIILQVNRPLPVVPEWLAIFLVIAALCVFRLINHSFRSRLYPLQGVLMNTLLVFTGAVLCYYRDISHDRCWIGRHNISAGHAFVTLEEPPSEKDHSFKAVASVQSIIHDGKEWQATGYVIVYFQKDTAVRNLDYGSQLIIRKGLTTLINAGNPGGFDYRRFYAFQGIYHQVYLKPGDYILLPRQRKSLIKRALFAIRLKTVGILHRYIGGSKESGLAEALLIGYKDDLDKTLVQSYSNTGVVHIIAISGMQLALIYGFLVLLFKPLANLRPLAWIRPVAVIIILWLFSIMSGASPSVLRAAVMFTCIVIGDSFSQKTPIHNNLAASAFLLLCYNPFWLWDIGFQLSYGAVLSISIFMKPIYGLVEFTNRSLDFIWELLAVSISAQILTTPVSIFYFHQFPNYFLLTNLVAVPVSTLVLFGELILLALSSLPLLAGPAGMILCRLIRLMNDFIARIEHLPFSLWNNLQINFSQVVLLYMAIISGSVWLFQKNRSCFFLCLCSLFGVGALRTISFIETLAQQKIIVYNVPQRQAIDFISGRKYLFRGDSAMQHDVALQRMFLTPARILYRLAETDTLPAVNHGNNLLVFGTKKILVLDQPVLFAPVKSRVAVDVMIICNNPALDLLNLSQVFDCAVWVIDASNSAAKMQRWKKQCEQLQLSCWPVVEKGAFEMKVD